MRQESIPTDIIDQQQADVIAAESNMHLASLQETENAHNQSLYEASAGKVFDTPFGMKGTIDELLAECPVPPHLRSPQKTDEFLAKLYVFNNLPAPKGHEGLFLDQQAKKPEQQAKEQSKEPVKENVKELVKDLVRDKATDQPKNQHTDQFKEVTDLRQIKPELPDQPKTPFEAQKIQTNEIPQDLNLDADISDKFMQKAQVYEVDNDHNDVDLVPMPTAPLLNERDTQTISLDTNIAETVIDLNRHNQEHDSQKTESAVNTGPDLSLEVFEKPVVVRIDGSEETGSIKNEVTEAIEKVMAFVNSHLTTTDSVESFEVTEQAEAGLTEAPITEVLESETDYQPVKIKHIKNHDGEIVEVSLTKEEAQAQLAALYLGDSILEPGQSIVQNLHPESEQKVTTIKDLLREEVATALAAMSERQDPLIDEVEDKLEYLDAVHQRLQYIVERGEKDSPEALQIATFIEQEISDIFEILHVQIEPEKLKLIMQKIMAEPETVTQKGFVLPADAGTHEYKRDDNVWHGAALGAISSITERAARVAGYILRGFPEVA